MSGAGGPGRISPPTFAVVGRVNKGKSSVVSTLIEDDSVRVDREPGTTRVCTRYAFRADDGRVLCYVVDTPGFEEAPRALTWLRERETSAAARPGLVAQFVETFRDRGEFADECALLEPVLAGAAILYVVDASLPYRANYEAEMEILRWSGRPGMALINRVGLEDHVEEWRRALQQYFSIVRVFDAHRSGFEERLSLLSAFRELDDRARNAIDEAISVLRSDWERRRYRSARAIAELIADALTHVEEHPLGEHDPTEPRRQAWESGFLESLRRRERSERRAIEALYRHERLERREGAIEARDFDSDLFADESRRVFGLDTWQLVRAGAVGGAAIGGTIDAATLGHSFLAGSVIGGVVGGAAAYFGGRRAAEIKVLGRAVGGRVAIVGPIRDANFPWILVDRAIMHHDSIVHRAHAQRDVMTLERVPGKVGASSRFDPAVQSRLGSLFAKLRRRGATGDSETVEALADEIERLLRSSATTSHS
jgi:hypothetical protein